MFFFENGMLIFELRFDEANFYISHFLTSRWYYKRQACYGIIAITIQYVYYQTNGSVLYVLLHTLQMFTGIYGVPVGFSTISMEKGCKNHRETLYSSKGKIVYVVAKPCNIYRLQETIGFPYNL